MFSASCSKEEREYTPPTGNNPVKADSGIVVDIEGNRYKTIVIGTQVWMAENLKTSRLRDGSVIPEVSETTQWAGMTGPALCWYSNDKEANREIHGALYNWLAVGSGKLAPSGWHVATREDWEVLIDYLGGAEVAGGKMKQAGFITWDSPNTSATNTSRFCALGSGGRYGFCSGFHDLKVKGYFWTATPSDTSEHAYYHLLEKDSGKVDNTSETLKSKLFGFSVRCVKD